MHLKYGFLFLVICCTLYQQASGAFYSSSEACYISKNIPQKSVRRAHLNKKLKGCISKADVVFLIDSSHSVGDLNFKQQLYSISDLVQYMSTGHNAKQFRYAAITYSTKADMVMSLKDFIGQPKAAARYIRSAIEYRPGQSGLGEGLKLAQMVGFDQDSGHRKNTEKVVIFYADTQGNTDTHPAKIAAELLGKHVTLLGVGIGSDISKKYMTSITKKDDHVLMAAGFKQLNFIKEELMGMICHNFRKKPKPTPRTPCPEGQKLMGHRCVIMGPTCKKKCPKNYSLVYPCVCIVEMGKCPHQCPPGKVNNKKCVCVLKHPPKCTLKKCPPRYFLNKQLCKCECRKICDKNLFTLDPGMCKCTCNSKCRENYILNPKSCTCNKIHCGKGYILYHGKCRNDIHKICPHGELLFRDICLKQKVCPNGYINKLGICKPKCPNGIDDDGNCQNTCKNGQFLLNGNCTKVTPMKCPGPSHFAVPAPLCPKTCEEPVPLTRCSHKGVPQPGCVCDTGFYLHHGRCIRASECPNKPICLKDADLVFMLDSSLSVGESNFFTMKSFIRSIVQQFDTKDGTKQRVSVFSFNEKVQVYAHFKDFKKLSHETLLKRIMGMKFKAGNSYLGEALHFARSQTFGHHMGMREDVPRILMLLTRGNPTSGTIDPYWEARKLRESGVTMIVIGVGENIESKTENLFRLAGAGGKVFVFALRKLQQIHDMVSRVLATRCDRFVCPSPRVIHKKCINEYQQLDRVEFYANGFKCQKTVVRNWKRVRCSCPKARTVRTSCRGMFRQIIRYNYLLDRKRLVCQEKSQRLKIRCRCPHVKTEVNACQDMIKRTKYTFYKLQPGGPEGYKCVAQFAWRSIRCDCPNREITHGPCVNNFRVRKTALYNLVQGHCVTIIRTTEIQCACPRPKIHTSACDGEHVAVKVGIQQLNSENHCDKSTYVGFKPCKQSCKNQMDVGILVDTSKSMDYTNFPLVRNFVASMVSVLPISRTGTHVALGRFSSAHRVGLLFDFFTFYEVKQAVNRINEMRYHSGSSSTGEGLQMMRLTAFTKTHGSRADVARVLYVITDSESNGDVSVLEEAKRLRGMGIQIVAIGIGKHVDPSYLQKLASKPHAVNVFVVRDFEALMSIKNQALESRCNAPGSVNHISVLNDIQAKLRKIAAEGGIDYSLLGLTKLDLSEMSLLSFTIKSYYTVVAGAHQWQQIKFASEMKTTIAKALKSKVYEVVNFKTIPGKGENKTIQVQFMVERSKGAEFIKLYKDKKIKLVSINKKPLELDEKKVAYISSYALRGLKISREVLSFLKEMGDEALELLKHQTPKEKEELEKQIHELNKEMGKSRIHVKTDQTKLVELCKTVCTKAVNLAKQAMTLARGLAIKTLGTKGITAWEIHIVNRHLRNLHEMALEVAKKSKKALEELETAEKDDVVKGKILPPKKKISPKGAKPGTTSATTTKK